MTKKFLILAILVLTSVPLFAQTVTTQWVRRYNGPDNSRDNAYDLAVDISGNVYVTGNGAWGDFVTIKYSPLGDTAWVRNYTGSGGSVGWGIAVTYWGMVHVTGWTGSYPNYDGVTLKYSPSGDTAWVRRYDGPIHGMDYLQAIAVDNSDNVYVTGYSAYSDWRSQFLTIKYYHNGDTAWVRRFSSSEGGTDYGYDIAVDDGGYVYVTGYGYPPEGSSDCITIMYYPEGDTVWTRRYAGPANGGDYGNTIAVDPSGNVYVTGSTWNDGTHEDYLTIKYDNSGNELWVAVYDGPINASDRSEAIAVDDSGNVCVTGVVNQTPNGEAKAYVDPSSSLPGTRQMKRIGEPPGDFGTIKYYPGGDTVWVRIYDGPGNSYDGARDVALDSAGSVYVTGYSSQNNQYPYNRDYTTIKYRADGDSAWMMRYNGPGDSDDEARAIAVDGSGNVYVTGYSFGDGGAEQDYATIKYGQTETSVGEEADGSIIPSFTLQQNYPNPFNPKTVIQYSIENPAHISLKVYNIKGQLIRTLVNQRKSSGIHRLLWDGKDAKGMEVSTGIYFYRLKTGEFTQTKKMVLLK